MTHSSRAEQKAQAQTARLRAAKEQLQALPIDYELRGLGSAEVAKRIELGLHNNYNQPSSRSLSAILRANLLTLFNLVVGGAFLILLLLGQWRDALFGIAVVSNILIGTIQEFRAKRTLDKLTLLHQPKARVFRNHNEVEIDVKDIVLDDLLILRIGDQVLADATVVSTEALEVDESILTGESDPVLKSGKDRVLAGSAVVGGHALVRVDAVGAETYASALTLEARRFSLVSSELRSAIGKIVKWISYALIPFMAITINGQMIAAGGWNESLKSGAWQDAVIKTVASISSMIPQGFILMTSLAFAIAAVTLARKNVLVQELPAVEGLARVDVICFDKTGTLTEGRIVFKDAEEVKHQSSLDWREVLAVFGNDPQANATTQSLAPHFVANPLLAVVSATPFNSLRKFSAFSFALGKKQETWVLGAPEFILDERKKSHREVLKQTSIHTSNALRTLVLAFSNETVRDSVLPKNLEVAAIITLQEAVRTDAAATVAYFKEQGVDVRIISGDNAATVSSIARQAGLDFDGEGFDARGLPEDQGAMADILEKHMVFGRVTPEQKRNMVLALQSRGHVVAMTGDGVNDALALKKADLGIAMNTGAAATKAVANMVLLDGRFSSLPGVVAEGRKVIANIERVSRLFLTKTTWSMVLALFFGIAMWSFPYLPRQLSGIDGFTIGIPAFMLALLPNSKRYEAGFLKRSLRFTIPAGLIIGTSVIVLNATIRSQASWSIAESQTATSVMLSVTGIWILVLLSLPLDRWKAGIVLVMILMCLIEFFWPWSLWFFSWVALSPAQLALTLGIAFAANALIFVVTRRR